MPISTVTVTRVFSSDTSKPGCRQHLIEGANEQSFSEQFFTLNDLKASLCERSKALGVPVRITWRDGRMKTRDIVFVEIAA